ncbi:MAG TPA: hypothetical protein VJ044_10690 [Candidatus Hodarchaeales archaeon]|nr:hypothetical protein [Candidatus Hodarchaeales archaeon]
MGLLDGLFGRKDEEPVEVADEQAEAPAAQVMVRIETLRDFVDIDRISRNVREGSIVFIKTKELQRKDLGEFQNCVAKLKRVSASYGFDLAGTDEGYLIVTPTFAKISR